MSRTSTILMVGPAVAVAVGLIAFYSELPAPAAGTAAITTLCAIWWVLEPIPIAATSLLPFAVLPFLGVLSHKEVAAAYGHHLILLLLGGFMLSKAIERSGAHRRIAVAMVRISGRGNRRLILGFMIASAVCSMWISNTATTLMLLPVAMAVLEQRDSSSLATPLLLGIAYAASIGGVATPVGTPPNVIFLSIFETNTGGTYSFLEWMLIGVPVTVVMIPVAWLLLTRRLHGGDDSISLPHPGRWRPAEVRVMAVFAITAVAWVFRTAPFGGWSNWFGVTGVGDSTVALAASAALFVLPAGDDSDERLLDWDTAASIPWGLLLLFGGGLALAAAFKSSGLSGTLGELLAHARVLPTLLIIAVICLSVTFLTEVTSNTATTTLLMPVLAAAGMAAGIPPEKLMIPAAISASCAFMLPVATAPNAIVFASSDIPARVMAREGIFLNLAGAVAITIVCSILV